MNAEQYRQLVTKLESIDSPVQEAEQLNELLPLVAAGALGIGALISSVSGMSDYMDQVTAGKKAVGNLTPTEVKELSELLNQLEDIINEPEVAQAIESDKALAARFAEIVKKGQTLQKQAAMGAQSAATTAGGVVGAAIKKPFQQAGKALGAVGGGIADIAKGAWNA